VEAERPTAAPSKTAQVAVTAGICQPKSTSAWSAWTSVAPKAMAGRGLEVPRRIAAMQGTRQRRTARASAAAAGIPSSTATSKRCRVRSSGARPARSARTGLDTDALGRLVEYMAGDAAAEELIYPVPELGIDVISVDRQSANPGAIIASQRMKELFASLRERYDYVLVDSTPVLGVTDSKLTAELVDVVLFVVRWEKTTKDVAEDALKQLVEHRVPLAGCVITQVNVKKHARYGYGGVDHYYSKYHKYYVN
jgi:hypothetical protein